MNNKFIDFKYLFYFMYFRYAMKHPQLPYQMKTIFKLHLYFLLFLFPLVLFGQVTSEPNPPLADGTVTLYFDKQGTGLSNYNGTIYAHIGLTINDEAWQNVIGNWGNNSVQPSLTHVSGSTYSLTLAPDLYEYFGVNSNNTINGIDVVFRSADGNQQTSPDIFIPVGAFQLVSSYPQDGETVLVSQGENLNISAHTTTAANWSLKANGSTVHSASGTENYTYSYGLSDVTSFELKAVSSGQEIKVNFVAIPAPDVSVEAIPEGMEQGINYLEDATKALLAVYAPGKGFVHLIGSFNNWSISNEYLMKKDTENPDLYWYELSGLTPGEVYTYQYRTADGIKTADPYSTLVLSPWDDPYITEAMYPNMPEYPEGQEFEVTVLQTNQPEYNWQVTNFQKPDKDELIIYELLIRDFNSGKTWNSLISDFNYLKNLNINAIEILPVMEFEGNISWGYNPAYHLALDKAYGNKDSMKAFIDLCHQNGIAVILDVALNHVYGRSPLVRMWMDDPDGDGFGPPTASNPYCHTEAKHAYNVGYDLNHQSEATQYYVKRTVEYWIDEFKIDGFRWDLTKGFTNNCTSNDEGCTNSYQFDRVVILKEYADYQWDMDPEFYVIFEHLGFGGSHDEEIEWAGYRADEGKGIMLWNKMTDPYNQNTMGYIENSSFNSVSHTAQGYDTMQNVAYAESHDEERIMFKNLEYGNSNSDYDTTDLATALQRQQALAAVLFTIPGPKIFWQFGELGYDFSINHCEDGSINNDCRTDPKPIPFEIGYALDENRVAVYNTWSYIFDLRRMNEVFKSKTYSVETGNLLPRIYIWDDNMPADELKNVVIFANFRTTPQTIAPYFPYTGEWVNMMDLSTVNVTATDVSFTMELQPGEFRIFGNAQPYLSVEKEVEQSTGIWLYPNPAGEYIYLSESVSGLEIYDLQGKKIKTIKEEIPQGYSIDISNLPQGIYFVKFNSNRKGSLRLIKK